MILVSHDMRLISQVAKEIWLCDKKTVTKYMGEISDFKMQLRRQMQQDNLIDSDKSGSSSILLAPMVNKKKNINEVEITIAPPLVVKSSSNISFSSIVSETEEQKVRRARLELADQAIAKQRARQSSTTSTTTTATTTTGTTSTTTSTATTTTVDKKEETEEEVEARIKAEEKLLARMKRKAEKVIVYEYTLLMSLVDLILM